MVEALQWGCVLATVFLMARQLAWGWAMAELWRCRGRAGCVAHLQESVSFSRGVLRLGTFTVSLIPIGWVLGWLAVSWGCMFILISWRIIHYADDRRMAVVALAGVLAGGVIISATGGQL